MSSNLIDVSIIIVNYNNFDLLVNCLNSILKYSVDVTYEIIVVDHNSSEGDVSDVIRKYEGVKLIKNSSNLGFGAANNAGSRIAGGKYLLLLNNDTELVEDSVSRVFKYAEISGEHLIVGCKLLNADLTPQESTYSFPSLWNIFTENFFLSKMFPKSKMLNKAYLSFIDISEPVDTDVVKGAFLFINSECYSDLNGFDERFYFYSEETDLCLRFKRRKNKIIYFPNTSIIHYGGENVGNDSWFTHKNLAIGKIQYYQKNFRAFKFICALILHYSGIIVRIPVYILLSFFLMKKAYLYKSFYFFKQLFLCPFK